ncbi:MAG: hypothetical protein HUU16_09830 [Candidatus Omnitrophica bacterium]|nr:hypothetical protein [bacterium]NUN96461.1 hypothetical protein [Candidatus Omnitrophota bacterium]
MTVEEQIHEVVKDLPPEKAVRVRAYAESLLSDKGGVESVHPPDGVLSHLDFDISFEEFKDLRREMWGEPSRDAQE